ncbi:uroporphyrinogen-III synthase [bacterium]|nr:uroporphyrinogen-III synthase [bacterium]MCI0604453.1 uroporphyrinogen-III synthase [bacterium]
MPEGKLTGRRILVTRSRDQAAELTRLLQTEDAIIYEIPSIEIILQNDGISKLQHELDRIENYSWLLLTSVNSVLILNQTLRDSGRDWKWFDTTRIGCIGQATAAKVNELGGRVSLVPSRYQAENLAEELVKDSLAGKKILLPRAARSRPILPEQLRQSGAIVEEIHIYKAEIAAQNKQTLVELLNSNQLDLLTFTSSSTVRNFAELAGEFPWQKIPVACIGPITAETLREYGVEPAIEAEEFTMQGLVEAIIRW